MTIKKQHTDLDPLGLTVSFVAQYNTAESSSEQSSPEYSNLNTMAFVRNG